MCSLPYNIGIKRMDGYTVSDDSNRWYNVYTLKISDLSIINFYLFSRELLNFVTYQRDLKTWINVTHLKFYGE